MQSRIAFTIAALWAGCQTSAAVMNGATKPAVPPETAAPPESARTFEVTGLQAAQPAQDAPQPPAGYQYALQADGLGSDWQVKTDFVYRPGQSTPVRPYLAENPKVKVRMIAHPYPDAMSQPQKLIEGFREDVKKQGGQVSEIDHMNGDGKHFFFTYEAKADDGSVTRGRVQVQPLTGGEKIKHSVVLIGQYLVGPGAEAEFGRCFPKFSASLKAIPLK